MTREEAIAFFKDMNECTYGNLEALEMAIKALEQTEPKKCGDCISRQELLNAIFQKEYGHDYDENTDILGLKYVDIIKRMPSVEPERKTGKWVHMVGWWECNQCHAEYTDMPTCMGKVIYEYCPICGAKMEVET